MEVRVIPKETSPPVGWRREHREDKDEGLSPRSDDDAVRGGFRGRGRAHSRGRARDRGSLRTTHSESP